MHQTQRIRGNCFWHRLQLSDVAEVNTHLANSMRLVVVMQHGGAPREFVFQSNHDAIIFQTTALQLLCGCAADL